MNHYRYCPASPGGALPWAPWERGPCDRYRGASRSVSGLPAASARFPLDLTTKVKTARDPLACAFVHMCFFPSEDCSAPSNERGSRTKKVSSAFDVARSPGGSHYHLQILWKIRNGPCDHATAPGSSGCRRQALAPMDLRALQDASQLIGQVSTPPRQY